MAVINAALYGSDEDYPGSETPDTGALPAGAESVSLQLYQAGAGYQLQSEELKFLGGRLYADKTIRGKLKLKLLHRRYPTNPAGMGAHFPEMEILKKPYTWISFSDYNITQHGPGKCRAVTVAGMSESRFRDMLMIEINLLYRKAE